MRTIGGARRDQGQRTSYATSENYQACRRPLPDPIAANASRRARHLNLCPRHAQPLPAASQEVSASYRGAWCSYCNIALSAYQQHLLPRLTGRGIGLVAISPQAPNGSLSMQEKHDLSFSVVSDPGNAIARGLGILTRPSDEARTAQLQLGLDLTAVNADGTVALPMPTVVIADAGHVVRWIDVHPDYSTRTEPAQILSALDRLGI